MRHECLPSCQQQCPYVISHESYITLPLKPIIEDDYLHIFIFSGPGRLEGNCVVNLPYWIDFELSSEGDAAITHSDDPILLKISPGPTIWQLKIIRSLSSPINQPSDHVTICDDQ